jgi:hypothetical protein
MGYLVLASSSLDSQIKLWNIEEKSLNKTINGGPGTQHGSMSSIRETM